MFITNVMKRVINRLINTVINGLTIKQGELDPLAGSSELTPSAYIDWLSGMTNTLTECLK